MPAEPTREGIAFMKMEGAGNDFVVVGAEHAGRFEDPGAVSAVCDRRRGVGADGVLVVGRAGEAEVELLYRNRDGSVAFCGNGTRCAAAFALATGLAPPAHTVLTTGRALAARVRRVGREAFDADVEMPEPDAPPRSVVSAAGVEGTLIVVGVPHVVVRVARAADVDLSTFGPTLRHDPAMGPGGANVNVVEGSGRHLVLRTHERGVEAETLACGSGAVAAAVTLGDVEAGTEISVASGDTLRVSRREGRLWLSGPARVVYRGVLGAGV